MKFALNDTCSMRVQQLLRVVISTLLLSFFWLSSANASPVDTFQFNDETTELRFQILSKELRCPKCQNQNLADSNSKIAIDLRKNLYNLLQEGKTDQEIIDFMVYRYGDFVLYRPPLKEQTYILWFGPLIILFGFIIGVVFVLRKRSKVKDNEHDLSAQEQTNLDDILNKK
ncbi:cytochrome c-type biogenesis protein [Colwellia sp. PAMC 21821]|uniref:cytochrome c-type biogenesis protein n=1 Tax=Colwellia sp. PAMC 21821 TaxID=1816219 RepID=UPI001E2A257E|nr:cytochrome c-type biogenesis protein [Colwellia sp. PAMC 21821]